MKLWIAIWGLLLSLTVQANDAAFRKTKKTVAMMGHGCNIRLQVPVRARVTSSPENRGSGGVMLENPFQLNSDNPNFQPFYLGFTCCAADDGIATKGWATYDDSSKKWKINLSPHDAEMFVNAHKTYQIKALNAQGWAVTINDVTGDEQWRQRHLHYCLIKDAKAVCGNGEMGYLRSGRKGNLTPYALQILRSIEFIDDTPPEQPTAAQ